MGGDNEPNDEEKWKWAQSDNSESSISSTPSPWKDDFDPFDEAKETKEWKDDEAFPKITEWQDDNRKWDVNGKISSPSGAPPTSSSTPEKSRSDPAGSGGPTRNRSVMIDGKPRTSPIPIIELQKEFGWPTTCAVITGREFVTGSILGAGIGLISGLQNGYATQTLRDPNFLRILRGVTLSNGLSIGISLAMWKGATCASLGIRKKEDIFNDMFGGAIAGAVFSLPSRNPRHILVSSLSYATLSCCFAAVTGKGGF